MSGSNWAANSSKLSTLGACTVTGWACTAMSTCPLVGAGGSVLLPGDPTGTALTMVWWSLRTLTIARASWDCSMPLAAASIRSKSSWYFLTSAGRSGARPGHSMYWRAATVRSTPWAMARSIANSSAVALLWAIRVCEPGGRPRRRAGLTRCAGSSGWPPSRSTTASFPGSARAPDSAGGCASGISGVEWVMTLKDELSSCTGGLANWPQRQPSRNN